MEAKDEIIKLFKDLQKRKVKSGSRSKSIHVSDLTSHCLRKTWYNFNLPKYKRTLTDADIANFFLGRIVHENTSLSKRNEVSVAGNVRKMEAVKSRDIGSHNFYDCVTGTIDDICEINGETYIVDKKTARYIPKEPDEGYVIQINIYKLLLYLTEGIEVNKGAILYLSKTDSFQKPVCYDFNL